MASLGGFRASERGRNAEPFECSQLSLYEVFDRKLASRQPRNIRRNLKSRRSNGDLATCHAQSYKTDVFECTCRRLVGKVSVFV